MPSGPTAIAIRKAPPIIASRTPRPTATSRPSRPTTTPSNANFVGADPGRLPAADQHRTARLWPARSAFAATSPAGPADLSIGRGHNSFDYEINDTLNTSFGPASQNSFDAGGLRYGQTIANLDFSRQFAIGLFKPLSVAVGAEYRREDFQIRPGELQSYAIGPLFRPAINNTTAANCAAQGGVFPFGAADRHLQLPRAAPLRPARRASPAFPPNSATDVDRHSYAGYVELDADPVEGLTVTLAGRYEHFSDFGSTVNGKFAARWEPIQGYAVRGSISNGFRAPSLQQQFFTTTSTNFINGVPVDIATLAVSSPGRAGARRTRPQAREVAQHQLRRDRQSVPRPDAHRRRLQHPHQGPHRADRDAGHRRHGQHRRGAGAGDDAARRPRLPAGRRRRASSSTASTRRPRASTWSAAIAGAPAGSAIGR